MVKPRLRHFAPIPSQGHLKETRYGKVWLHQNIAVLARLPVGIRLRRKRANTSSDSASHST
jgi:hypothetical protein